MNDRYLFRAKRIDTGEWYIGNLVDCPDGRNVIAEVGGNWALHEVDPSTICQCTGLKDKNGNMVFENDIMVGYLDDIFQDNATYSPYSETIITTAKYDSQQKIWHLQWDEQLNALMDIDDSPLNGDYITHWMPLPKL